MSTVTCATIFPGTTHWRGGLPVSLHDSRGTELFLRFLVPADEPAIRGLHERCSTATLRWRYFGGGAQVEHLLSWIFDTSQGEAVGVWAEGRLVAIGNLILPDATGTGEVAFLVEDAWQGRGIGSALVDLITDLGRDEGCRCLHADVSLDNGRMRVLFAKRDWHGTVIDGDYSMDLALAE